MPEGVYEVAAQGARYWFLFLMTLIVWRSWRWYRRDKRQAKKRLKLLPDAGFVGEMVVTEGDEALERGTVLAVPREGTLGTLRTNDLCLPPNGVEKRHLWFRFDDEKGLMVEPFGKNAVHVDGEAFQDRHKPLYMGHGSRLYVGAYELRLRLFVGFEAVAYAACREPVEPAPEEPQAVAVDELWARQQWMLQQQAYREGYEQAMRQLHEAEEMEEAEETPDTYPEPPTEAEADAPVFYPPVMDDDDDPRDWPYAPDLEADVALYDEDLTDAAAPPKSAYVGHDEAERAKRRVWDRYFGRRG